jgi:hypothetical protein
MHLFSCEFPSLELNFVNLGCVYFPGKSSPFPQPQYWRFLAFYPKCFLFLQSQHLLCIWDKSQSYPHNLQDFLVTKKISLPWSAQSCPGHHGAFYKGPFPTLMSDSQPWVCVCLEMADLPTLRPQQLGSGTREGDPQDPHGNKVCSMLDGKLLEMPFQNCDQRNTRESLSKAKRSFTSAEGCSHWPYSDRQDTLSKESAQFSSLCPSPCEQVWVHSLPDWLAIVWSKGKVFWCSDIFTAQWESDFSGSSEDRG